jgi:hypothetical protein
MWEAQLSPYIPARFIKERDMKARLLVLFSLVALLVAGCGTVQTPQDLEAQKVAVRLATLSGSAAYPAANGKATYKVDNNGIREFEVEIQDVARTLRGKTLNVFVNTTKVGTMTINTLGDGRLDLVGARAPVIAASAKPKISIKTAAGATVASGVMNQLK